MKDMIEVVNLLNKQLGEKEEHNNHLISTMNDQTHTLNLRLQRLEANDREIATLHREREHFRNEYNKHFDMLNKIIKLFFGEKQGPRGWAELIDALKTILARREKKDKQIAELQEENICLEHILEEIMGTCKAAGVDVSVTDHKDMVDQMKKMYLELTDAIINMSEVRTGATPSENPTHGQILTAIKSAEKDILNLNDVRLKAHKRTINLYKEEQAKASKLNSEKRMLMKLMLDHSKVTAWKKYDEWLKQQAKKRGKK